METWKIVDTALPKFLLETLKNIYLKLDLPDWCNFCWYIVLLAIHEDLICHWQCQSYYSQSHCLLPSNFAKISFINTLLIFETTFHLTAKISIALCWPIYLKTLKVFSLGFYTWRQILRVIRKKFPRRISPQPECGMWSKISYGDEWTSSQTFNHFFCIFSGKTFFLFN